MVASKGDELSIFYMRTEVDLQQCGNEHDSQLPLVSTLATAASNATKKLDTKTFLSVEYKHLCRWET